MKKRRYEMVYILDPELTNEGLDSLNKKIEEIIRSEGGEVFHSEDWGIRNLAYLVKKRDQGHYFLLQFYGHQPVLEELKRNFRIMDGVLKYLIVRMEEKESPRIVETPNEEVVQEEEV